MGFCAAWFPRQGRIPNVLSSRLFLVFVGFLLAILLHLLFAKEITLCFSSRIAARISEPEGSSG